MSKFRWPKYTRKGFVAWLRAHDKGDDVGNSCEPECCPLATYLHAEFDIPDEGTLKVLDTQLSFVDSEGVVYLQLLPQWAERFVEQLDDRYLGQSVTAAQVREIFGA